MMYDYEYESFLHNIRRCGERTEQRAELRSTGEKPYTLSMFAPRQIKFALDTSEYPDGSSEVFPLVTTKRIAFKAMAHELIWFLRGDMDINYLKENGVKIWDQWAKPNGDLGPVYGKNWRDWERPLSRWKYTPEGTIDSVDQIVNLEQDIASVVADQHHRAGRRMLLLSYNPGDMPDPSVPSGCHTMSQYSVRTNHITGIKRLSCHLYMR
jgi:thymidylate synthase